MGKWYSFCYNSPSIFFFVSWSFAHTRIFQSVVVIGDPILHEISLCFAQKTAKDNSRRCFASNVLFCNLLHTVWGRTSLWDGVECCLCVSIQLSAFASRMEENVKLKVTHSKCRSVDVVYATCHAATP